MHMPLLHTLILTHCMPDLLSAPRAGARMKRITNDAREDEMEENLDHVGNIVGDLRAQVRTCMLVG